MECKTVKIVIGSWGSYNECNERALGSAWLDLSKFTLWDEIDSTLKEQGFDLNGIDEELFVQDVEPELEIVNTDALHPRELFETLQNSGVLKDEYLLKIMLAYCEVAGYESFAAIVRKNGENWADDIVIYPDYTCEDIGREVIEESGLSLPDWAEDYFDYRKFGESLCRFDNYHEYSGGIIYIA